MSTGTYPRQKLKSGTSQTLCGKQIYFPFPIADLIL